MTWSKFVGELDAFAAQLNKLDQTQATANALQALNLRTGHWRANPRLASLPEGIPIPVPRNKALLPNGLTLGQTYLAFSFELTNLDEEMPRRADFQVRVLGELQCSWGQIELEDHWRIDSDHDSVNTANEPHPAYHFQRGGHAQEAFVNGGAFVPGNILPQPAEGHQWRGLMQYTGPRMLTPPMCPILAVDFVIGQNDGPLWSRLRNVPEYSNIIRQCQKRLWINFFSRLNDRTKRKKLLGRMMVE